MQQRLVLPAIAMVVALGALIGTMYEVNVMQSEEITGFSYFPMPTLPSAKVVNGIVSGTSMQNSEYVMELAGGHDLISVKQDSFYGETTLFYATPKVQKTISYNDSIQNLVKKGVIVFDYEKIDNLKDRTLKNTPIFMTKNSNPVYTDSGLNGEYLTIAYIDENIRLSVYGNSSIDLRALVKSLDL